MSDATANNQHSMPGTAVASWAEGVLSRFGFPTLLSIVLMFFVYTGLTSYYTDVVKPQADTHMRLVQTLEKTLEQQQTMLAEMQRSQAEIAKTLERISARLEFGHAPGAINSK